MDNFLCISKTSFDDHLEKRCLVLIEIELCDAGLEVNVPKLLFCATEVEYLGYVLTQERIKPHQKKVDAILAPIPPKNVKDV